MISQAYKQAEADLGYTPECYYLIGGPGGTGGITAECRFLWPEVEKNLKIVKSCKNNALANGCIPKYKGLDTLKQDANPEMSPEEIAAGMVGCTGWTQDYIDKSLPAYVLADGQIIISYANGLVLIMDVNGKKGPNTWGQDIFGFYTGGSPSTGLVFGQITGCLSGSLTGKTMQKMLQNP
jgi:hypothetical protein